MNNVLKHKDLVHRLEDNAVFSDVSIQVNDYLRDDTKIKLGDSNTWYIGYTKPFQWLFFELATFNTNQNALLTYEYWDGSSWQALPNLFDDTKNFQRSGFVRWEFLESDKIKDSWKLTAVDSVELYWVRISSSLATRASSLAMTTTGNTDTVLQLDDTSAFSVGQEIVIEDQYTTINALDATSLTVDTLTSAPADGAVIYDLVSYQGANIVFCDDQDLRTANPRIDDYLLKGQNSFINYRVEATKEIIQSFRTGGYVKILNANSDFLPNSSVGIRKLRQMTKWDVLDIDEIREAAKFLTLAKIFFEVSENVDDKAYIKYRDYLSKYGQSFANYYLTLDIDDDGETDITEDLNENFIKIDLV